VRRGPPGEEEEEGEEEVYGEVMKKTQRVKGVASCTDLTPLAYSMQYS
jgi:hypothetical protein